MSSSKPSQAQIKPIFMTPTTVPSHDQSSADSDTRTVVARCTNGYLGVLTAVIRCSSGS